MGKRGDHSFQPINFINMHMPHYSKHSGHRTPCGFLDPGIADPLCWRPGALVEITDLKAGVFAGG